MTADFDFSSQTQSFMNTLSNFTIRFEWSAFPKPTSKPYKQSEGDLTNLELAVIGCTASIMTCTVNLLSFSSVLSPEWPITWSGLTLSLPDKFSFIKPLPTHWPHHHPLFNSPDTVNLT